MYSFYGGRPGNSFIIIANYDSIEDMVTNFKKGPNYTDVHFDEYVIINTVNKNNPDNGKIYKRGYDFNNEMGGAEYVGTIVGPAGKAPMLEMTTVDDVDSKSAEEGYEDRYASGSYTPQDGNLIPGKDNDNFNDSISWASYSIRDENHEDTIAYIGFTIPYLVLEFETEQVEPYKNGVYADTSSATRVDDKTHPFFEKWKVDIPKGIKGNSTQNLRVETATSSIEPYDGRADDINSNRQVLVYDYYDYSSAQNGAPKKLYLGDYNMIEDIDINDQGTIQINYTHKDNDIWSQKLKWINSVSLNNSTGAFTVSYNHGTDYTVRLDWVKNLTVNNDGTVTISYTQSANRVYDKLIKWVSGITLLGDGTMQIHWNTGESDTVFSKIVKWISSVDLANDGTLTIGYNNGASPTVFPKMLKWINGVNLDEDGTITFTYNNDTSPTVFSKAIKTLKNIDIHTGETEGQGSQKIAVQWNDSDEEIQIGNPINYIMETAVDDQNNLLIRYSDPVRRAQGGVTWNDKDGWTNVGTIASAVDTELARYVIEDYDQTEIGGSFQTIASAISNIRSATESGQPTPVELAEDMLDPSSVYLYQGRQSGYKKGYLYYYSQDQQTWLEGSAYGVNITIDSALLDNSPNPVENRAIASEIRNLDERIQALEQGGGSQDSYIIDGGFYRPPNSVANNSTEQIEIRFSKTFTKTPKVIVGIGGLDTPNAQYSKLAACVLNNTVTQNGFQFYIANTSGSSKRPTINWIAVQV